MYEYSLHTLVISVTNDVVDDIVTLAQDKYHDRQMVAFKII